MSVRVSPPCAAPIGQTAMRPGRRRIVWRDCCRFPRRRSIWPAVRARTFRWHGGLCLDHRSAVASHADRDRRPADLRQVAAAQYISAGLCGGASCDWTQLWPSQWNVGRHQRTIGQRTSYRRPFGPAREGHTRDAVLFLRAVGGQRKAFPIITNR